MANRFWVGGGSSVNWSATSNTNWASSSGGSNNASVPGTGDVAIFDSNSGSGNSVLNVVTAIQGLDCTGGTGNYAGTITHNAGATLTINTGAASSFRLASGMTYTVVGSVTINFTHTSGTAQLTSAGKALPNVTINGAGGTTQQQDDLAINAFQNATLNLGTGTFDCNGHALTATLFNIGGFSTRTMILGSALTVGGNISGGTPINASAISSLTFTKNSCNVTVLSPTTNIGGQTLSFGALTWNSVTINSTTTQVITTFGDSSIFSSLSIGSGNFLFLIFNNTITITSAFTWAGTSSAPIMVSSSSTGAKATISCPSGSCTFNWVFLYNIVTSGGATFTATNALQQAGGAINNGFAISLPADGTSAGIPGTLWTDLLAGSDFSTGSSVGALLKSLTNLQYTVQAIGRGTVTSGATLTSIPTSAYTTAPSASIGNQLSGHAVLFDATTTTTALRGQISLISASTASSTPTLTVAALTATPASGDTFSVI